MRTKWDIWSNAERQEFAQAIGVAYSLVDDKKDILRFLMKHGSYWVAMTIALPVATILPIDESTPFLIEAISSAGPDKSLNFYQALASTGSPKTAPAILDGLEYYIHVFANSPDDEKIKRAVWSAENCINYLRELHDLSSHSDQDDGK